MIYALATRRDLATAATARRAIAPLTLKIAHMAKAAGQRRRRTREPIGHDAATPTAVEERGVSVEWWLAVANRAPFVSTRVFVEAFNKPVTRGKRGRSSKTSASSACGASEMNE